MPQLYRRTQRAEGNHAGTDARNFSTGAHPAVAPPILERKIHPDINLLAEKLESSYHRGCGQSKVEVLQDPESSALEIADFTGLEPSTRSQRFYKKAHKRDNSRL